MAALRHAARRLCERALQQSHRVSPGRLSMSTSSSVKAKRSFEKMHEESEKKRRELEDLLRSFYRDRSCTDTKSGASDYGTTARRSVFVCALPLFLGSVYYKKTTDGSLKEQNNDMN